MIRPLAAITATLLLLSFPAAAQDAEEKEPFCIDTRRIDRTTVIDNQTILVEMVGRDDFRKITLSSRCPGLKIAGGFSYETRLAKLCRTEIIRPVQEPLAAPCAIDSIAAISPEEAEALRQQR